VDSRVLACHHADDVTDPVSRRSASAIDMPYTGRARGWFAYVAAWIAAAGFWALAAAGSSGMSPVETFPYGLMVMTVAGLMGVGVWQLTDRVHWRTRTASFFVVHVAALACYAIIYALSSAIPDLVKGNLIVAARGLRDSPVLIWSLLMGSWLYVMVAGIAYAIRSERERAREAAGAADARLLAHQAQLSALRAQLNPHFLFNALHTVSALVTHDPAAADRAIDRLGDLLRYAMSDEEMVPLAAEWAFVGDYLAFEQLRLGDRLRVVERLEPAAADCLIPALILQPLLENAVRHGVSARAEGGSVQADARVDGDVLIIRVADNGPGREGQNGRRNGLGLASVRKRIAAAYGERGSVAIDNSDGYSVTMRIPAE
jgi:signal transduction histidine kinase